ncbi:hypothetical protein EYF80_049064 [Liparis tanakae]|uniref:Uncharacterized protein n=1 Tax=Liparis tanakae TaxID=230148 RepID=A0A4Z2FIM1_9TELE|nr:hypothetical protein EYF80_049064 [Liparis tanakae]
MASIDWLLLRMTRYREKRGDTINGGASPIERRGEGRGGGGGGRTLKDSKKPPPPPAAPFSSLSSSPPRPIMDWLLTCTSSYRVSSSAERVRS